MTDSNLPISKEFFDTTARVKITPTNIKIELNNSKEMEEISNNFKKLVILNKDNKNFINRIYNFIIN